MTSKDEKSKLPEKPSSPLGKEEYSEAQPERNIESQDVDHHLLESLKKLGQIDQNEISIEGSLTYYRGPHLPPEILRAFEEVIPGSGKKILDQTDRQIKHRHSLEKKKVEGWEKRAQRGQISGISSQFIALILAGYAIYTNSWASTLLAGIVILSAFGGPVAARIIANRFPWANKNSASEKTEAD